MKNIFKYITLAMLVGMLLLTNGCNQQVNRATTTSIYFENGTVKQYKTSDKINPFRDVKVKFSGKANKGTATIDTSNCEDIVKENFNFVCENNGSLANGGTAVIKAVYDKNALVKAGYTITADEKSYMVTGVDFYPRALKNYEKDDLNRAIRKLADAYIDDNIQSFEMEFNSGKNRNGWSKSGSFSYTYNYHDRIMIYNYNRSNRADNAYFIIYELSNDISCTEDMTVGENPLKAGESDIGWAYIVAGATNVTATSDMVFNDYFNKKEASEIIRSFVTYEEAVEYCTLGGNYITLRELFG